MKLKEFHEERRVEHMVLQPRGRLLIWAVFPKDRDTISNFLNCSSGDVREFGRLVRMLDQKSRSEIYAWQERLSTHVAKTNK